MIDIPLGILMTVIVFIVFLTALYFIFGAPQCDSLANQTAYSIKIAVDTVAADNFPMWMGSEPPSDSDYAYYSTANIRLCQERGVTFWESFFGNPPQYQIYYEIFPEGVFIWNEAYPWSGGAAGTLKFWGAMRIGTGAFKLASSLYSKLTIAGLGSEAMEAVVNKVRADLLKSKTDELLEAFSKYADEGGDIVTKIEKPGEVIVELHKIYEADTLYESMKKMGFIFDEVDDADGVKRFIIKDAPIDIKISEAVKQVDGSYEFVETQLFVQRDASGKIIDATTEQVEGFEKLQMSPKDIFDNYYNSVSDNQKKYLDRHFTTNPKGIREKIAQLPRKIKDTTWYQDNFQPIVDKLKSYVKRVDTAGFDVEIVEVNGRYYVFSAEKLLSPLDNTDPVSLSFWRKTIIDDPTLSDKIRKTIGLSTAEELTEDHIYKYLTTISDNFNGYVFIPKEVKWRINLVGIELFRDNQALDAAGLKSAILNYAEGTDMLEKIAGNNLEEFDTLVGQAANEIISNKQFAGSTGEFTTEVFFTHMENARINVDPKEISLMLGTLEQNKNTLPMTTKAFIAQGVIADVKRVVYLDTSAIANPGSWYAQGFFASRALEGCEGNSICLLGKNNLESPLYLEEQADRFDIKLWRPVTIWQQFAGLQAAIMQVPSNPRFYVVSPCFALAKVWKTNYEGVNTIFILPEKVNTSGSSNYCYADSDLINQYTVIWAVTDILSFMPWTSFLNALKFTKPLSNAAKWGLKAGSTYADLAGKIVDIVDPSSVIQAGLESMINWPGAPWTPLDYQAMIDAQQNIRKELAR